MPDLAERIRTVVDDVAPVTIDEVRGRVRARTRHRAAVFGATVAVVLTVVTSAYVVGGDSSPEVATVNDSVASSVAPPAPSTEFAPGDAIGVIEIPTIGVEKTFIEGQTVDLLKRGPGHNPDTPLPGEGAGVVISGHRTTYGAPFNRLGELMPGDEIVIRTADDVELRYEVVTMSIVVPTALDAIETDHDLVLATFHPEYSARYRLLVYADLT